MLDKGTVKMIKVMSNKELVHSVNRLKKEKADPRTYGKDGTTRWVTTSDFYGGHHKVLKDELKKRQREGKISSAAGKPKQRQSSGYGFKMPKIRF